MKKLLLKLHAWFYRRTGIYTKYARRREKEYFDSHISIGMTDIDKRLIRANFDIKYGFTRTSKQVSKDLAKSLKKKRKALDKLTKEAQKDGTGWK